MKKLIVLIFLSYCLFNSYSQNTTKATNLDFKKNAIGISAGLIYTNGIPIYVNDKKDELGTAAPIMFSYGLPKSGIAYHIEFNYKRYINKKNAFRIGSSNIFTNITNYKKYVEPLSFNIEKEKYSCFENDFSIGFEHSFGNRKTKFILGEDVLLGYKRDHFQSRYTNKNFILIKSADYFANYFKLGIALNLGVEYAITPKFAIGLKAKPEFVLLNELLNKNTSFYSTARGRIINFNLRSELTFAYNF